MPVMLAQRQLQTTWSGCVAGLIVAILTCCSSAQAEPLLQQNWNPTQAAQKVLDHLIKVSGPKVKGAHDAEMVLVGDQAYIVAEMNDVKPGEDPRWPEIYVSMSIVNIDTLAVEHILPIAHGEEKFENETLPAGACFAPRLLKKDETTLRCFFTSEEPGKRQSQVWYRDYDLLEMAFAPTIHPAKLSVDGKTYDMQPRHFYQSAARQGFKRLETDYGLYIFDSFKTRDGQTTVTLNNYPGGQNALAVLLPDCETFEVLGHFNEPFKLKLTESAAERLPDGTWLAVCRQEGGDRNYLFTTSKDGKQWKVGEELASVRNGTSSKPTLNCFNGVYYLGWQEGSKINDVSRSVFNIDVSRDGVNWERKYRFETEKSFQYPAFHQHEGKIWLCVTQGDSSPSRKERIMFGLLEEIGK